MTSYAPPPEPQDTINAATQAFEQGVEDAAALILACARETDIGETIGTTLRQQWPAYPEKEPGTSAEIKQERDDQNAREQTAKMTATMLINALAYQQNLAGYSAEVEVNGQKATRVIKSLTQIRKPTGLHPDDVIAEWENILSINYWPIFHIAKQLLTIIPPTAAARLLPVMVETANAVQDAIRQNDVAGTVFPTADCRPANPGYLLHPPGKHYPCRASGNPRRPGLGGPGNAEELPHR